MHPDNKMLKENYPLMYKYLCEYTTDTNIFTWKEADLVKTRCDVMEDIIKTKYEISKRKYQSLLEIENIAQPVIAIGEVILSNPKRFGFEEQIDGTIICCDRVTKQTFEVRVHTWSGYDSSAGVFVYRKAELANIEYFNWQESKIIASLLQEAYYGKKSRVDAYLVKRCNRKVVTEREHLSKLYM